MKIRKRQKNLLSCFINEKAKRKSFLKFRKSPVCEICNRKRFQEVKSIMATVQSKGREKKKIHIIPKLFLLLLLLLLFLQFSLLVFLFFFFLIFAFYFLFFSERPYLNKLCKPDFQASAWLRACQVLS